MKIKQMMLKTASALSAVAVITAALPAFSSVSVSAAETTPSGYISENIEYMEKYSDAIDALYQGLYNHSANIDISRYRIPLSDIKTVYTITLDTHPEIFYTDLAFSYNYNSLGVVYFKPSYAYTAEEVEEMRVDFNQKSDWLLRNVDQSMSDFEKALILHDELVLNSSYNSIGDTYEIIVNSRGKCYGYAEAYAFLLAQVGVKTEIISSDEMVHAWVKVCVDGVYYNVDVTWDDPVRDRPGLVEHQFFLLSDEKIQNLPRTQDRHYGYTSDFVSDTKYDDMLFHDVTSGFCYVDGKLYGICNKDSGAYAHSMISYDYQTDTAQVVKKLNYRWYVLSGGGSYWSKGYSSLDYYNGLFYFNSPSAIYTYDIRTDTTELYAENTFEYDFYGMRIVDGSVYAAVTKSPSDESIVEYIGECVRTTEPLALGDVDGNGVINISDATQIQRFIAEIIKFDSAQLDAADFNGDGAITIADVTAIQVYIAST